MAQFHNALARATEIARAYKNALGLGEGGLERAGETLMPTMPLFERPEWAVQREEYLGTVPGYSAAGGAGQYSGVGIACPAGSDQLLVIEPETWGFPFLDGVRSSVNVYLATETQITTALAVGAAVPVSRDTRNWASAGTSRIRITGAYGTTAGAIGTLLGIVYTLTDTSQIQTIAAMAPIVCSPGWGVALRSGDANIAMRCSIKFRIRRALPGELSA